VTNPASFADGTMAGTQVRWASVYWPDRDRGEQPGRAASRRWATARRWLCVECARRSPHAARGPAPRAVASISTLAWAPSGQPPHDAHDGEVLAHDIPIRRPIFPRSARYSSRLVRYHVSRTIVRARHLLASTAPNVLQRLLHLVGELGTVKRPSASHPTWRHENLASVMATHCCSRWPGPMGGFENLHRSSPGARCDATRAR